MRIVKPLLAVAATAVALAAAAQAPVESRRIGDSGKVEVEADAAASFAAYKTYAWLPATERPANFADHMRIMQTVESELAAKGFTKDAAGKPDVYVGYSASSKKKMKGESYAQNSVARGPSDVRTMVDFKRVEEQTIVVELRDGKTREPVFTGTWREPLQRADDVALQLIGAVKTILAEYPPKPEPSPSPAQ
jgi:hypothetical protein